MSENILNDIKMLLKTELLGIREEIKGLHQELEELRIQEDPKEMTDNTTEPRNGIEREATGTVQYLIRREEIKPIFTGEPGGKYTFEDFKVFISNRLTDEEEITHFIDDRAKIKFIARFLDGDAAKWWNVTMKSDSFAASNCQVEMASFWSAMAERYAVTKRPYEEEFEILARQQEEIPITIFNESFRKRAALVGFNSQALQACYLYNLNDYYFEC